MARSLTKTIPNLLKLSERSAAEFVFRLHVQYSIGVAIYVKEIQRHLSQKTPLGQYLEKRAFEEKRDDEDNVTEIGITPNIGRTMYGLLADPETTSQGVQQSEEDSRLYYETLEAFRKNPSVYDEGTVGKALNRTGKHSALRVVFRDRKVPEPFLTLPILDDSGEGVWSKASAELVKEWGKPETQVRKELAKLEDYLRKRLANTFSQISSESPEQKLKAEGALGTFPPFFKKNGRGLFSPLNKGSELKLAAMSTAFSILGSHYSRQFKNRNARGQRRLEAASVEQGPSWVHLSKIAEYEQGRRIACGSQDYFLGLGRDLRGWGKCRERWIKAKDRSEENLLRLADVQKSGGDVNLLGWLAQAENHALWDGREAPQDNLRFEDDYDYVRQYAAYNALKKPKKGEGLTLPHPLLHPCWVQVRNGGGSNHLDYSLIGVFREMDLMGHRIGLKPNKRWVASNAGFCLRGFRGPDGQVQEHPVKLGGAKIIISRRFLENALTRLDPETKHTLNRLPSDTDWEAVTQKVVEALLEEFDVQGVRAQLSVAVTWEAPPIENSDLIMGFDAGVRDIGGYALIDRKSKTILSQGILSSPLPPEQQAEQEAYTRTFRRVHRETMSTLALLHRVTRRIKGQEDDGLEESLKSWSLNPDVLNILAASPQAPKAARPLTELTRCPHDLCQAAVFLNAAASCLMTLCRHVFAPPGSRGLPSAASSGLLLDRIAVVDEMARCERKFRRRTLYHNGRLVGASCSDDGKRLRRLIQQREGLMKDYQRKAAHEVVQMAASLGAPFIVQEDLSKFKPWGERKRATNRMLSRWAPRAIAQNIEQIASSYGIKVVERSPYLSSQFEAQSRTPVVRVDVVTPDTLEAPWWKPSFEDYPERQNLKVGDIYISHGPGKYILVKRGKGYDLMEADANAAANLALSFDSRERVYARAQGLAHSPHWVVTSGSDPSKSPLSKKGTLLRPNDGKVFFQEITASQDTLPPVEGPSVPLRRDISGEFFNPSLWVAEPVFLGTLKSWAKKIVDLENSRRRSGQPVY